MKQKTLYVELTEVILLFGEFMNPLHLLPSVLMGSELSLQQVLLEYGMRRLDYVW